MTNPIQSANAPQGTANQVVFTPDCILDLVRKIWPEGEIYDPFPAPLSPAALRLTPRWRLDGFTEPWPNQSYANPPFKFLKKAMQAAVRFSHFEAQIHGPKEALLLGPAQTHRDWFWGYGGDVKGWLKPLAFHGYSNTFPRPLVLHWYGFPEQKRVTEVVRIIRDSGLFTRVTE